jgi:hypothetical protein
MLQRCGYTVRLWVYGEKADSFRKNLYGIFGMVCTPVADLAQLQPPGSWIPWAQSLS